MADEQNGDRRGMLTSHELMNCLGLILSLVGEEGRAELRRHMLEHSENEDHRMALETMNKIERAYDRMGGR